jgi:hypothetical protein
VQKLKLPKLWQQNPGGRKSVTRLTSIPVQLESSDTQSGKSRDRNACKQE